MSATAIRYAVTMCIRHGITPDRLAQLIAGRQAEALRPRKPNPPRKSVRQDKILAVLVEGGAAGLKVLDISRVVDIRQQCVRSQLAALAVKGLACSACGADGVARHFRDQASADAWLQTPEAQAVRVSKRSARTQRPHAAPKGPTKRSLIHAMAEKAGAAGITSMDAAAALSLVDNNAQAHMASMKGKLLWSAKVRGHATRWFASIELAEAWTRNTSQIIRLPKARSAPVAVKAVAPTGPVITPNGVRVTYAPTPVGRFEVAANELTGGFSTSRPGINPLTGKAW